MLHDIPMKIRNGSAVISILGLGRVGLPLAVVMARSGLKVIGVDMDASRVSMINRGEMPFYYPALQQWLSETVGAGMLVVSTSSEVSIQQSDVVVVTVGTPTGEQHELDYTQIHSAFRRIASAGIRDKAILVRSTSVPGTLTNIVLPLLLRESGLRLGEFALAACPERILEGQAHTELYVLPEIIGGIDELSVVIASELFRKISPEKRILVTSPSGAELAKLFTNIYRYVNFALSNEFAIWAERYGEDAHEIIRIANERYPRTNIPKPGFAGGPCLGKDGILLDNSTTFSSIISTAWKLNEAVPQHVVMSLMKEFGSLYGKKVSVLGLAFKSNSDDARLSPSAKVVEILKAYGAEVIVHDPYIKQTQSLDDALRSPEIVILATNHSVFNELAPRIDASGSKIFYDVWGTFTPTDFKNVQYRRFGTAG